MNDILQNELETKIMFAELQAGNKQEAIRLYMASGNTNQNEAKHFFEQNFSQANIEEYIATSHQNSVNELEKVIAENGGKLHVNPIELSFIDDDYSDEKTITTFQTIVNNHLRDFYESCNEYGISSQRANLLLTFLHEYAIRNKLKTVKEDVIIDSDEDTLADCISHALQKYANNKDKLIYPNISRSMSDMIKHRHPISANSKIIYYREASKKHTFIITTTGLSHNNEGNIIEIPWKKMAKVEWDKKDSLFYFFDIEHADPVTNISNWDLLKWDSDEKIIIDILNSVADCFIDDSEAQINEYWSNYNSEKFEEALTIANSLLVIENTRTGYYHWLKGLAMCMLLEHSVVIKPNDIEDEFELALANFTKEEAGIYSSNLYYQWGLLKEHMGNNRLAREKYMLSMDFGDKTDNKKAREGYNKLIKTNIDNWNRYSELVAYTDRKLIIPVKEVSGCVTDDITAFQYKEIPACITFPSGHPILNELYIGHPYNPSIYVPYKSHEFIFFLDKIDELCYVLQCLGAEEISITSIKGKSIDISSNSMQSFSSAIDVKTVSASIKVQSNTDEKERASSNQEICQIQRFSPTVKPYLPKGLCWYPFEAQWQRLVQQRCNGNMLEYHQVLSTKDTSFVSNNEKKNIELSMQYLMSKTNTDRTKENEQAIDESLETQWRVDVIFKSTELLTQTIDVDEKGSTLSVDSLLSTEEQQYKEEVLFYLETGELGEFERKCLDRKRIKLGLSEACASQIEASCQIIYSDEEKEYINIYKSLISDGEISARDRKILIHEAAELGISEERANELESVSNESTY